jgi:8-oxo-dGTP diphosphatase
VTTPEHSTEASGAFFFRTLRDKCYCPYCGGATHALEWEGRPRRYCPQCRLPLYENPVPAVCAVVRDARGRILLVQRKVPPHVGEWCLPGGFMELGETPEAAVLRELKEETGLVGEVAGLIGLQAAPNRIYETVLVAGYRVEPLSVGIASGDDAMAVRWYSAASLPSIAFGSHRAFIKAATGATSRPPEDPNGGND